MSALEIQQMPRKEKLRLMEALWADLSRDEAEVESPAWHANALRETAARVARGEENILDWERAKTKLRKGEK
jgi:Putative addiction module component